MHCQNNQALHKALPQTEHPWKEAAQTVTVSLFLAFGIRTHVVEARYVPTGSMEPTIEINDTMTCRRLLFPTTSA